MKLLLLSANKVTLFFVTYSKLIYHKLNNGSGDQTNLRTTHYGKICISLLTFVIHSFYFNKITTFTNIAILMA